MKKAINAWSFPSALNISQQMDLAIDAKFQGYEPALSETGELSLESKDSDISTIKEMASDKNIELASLASGLYWTYPCNSNFAKTRAKSTSIIKRQLECAALLEVDTILVVPGLVGASFIENSETIEYDLAFNRAVEAISSVADYAKSCNVKIGIENVWNKFLLSPIEMKYFLEIINHDYVGSYFDVGNVIPYGFPEHWIKVLGDKIFKVHIKDFRESVGNINGFVDLLSGDVNFPAVVKALKDIKYDGFLTAEMGVYKDYSDQIVYNTSNAMDRIIAMK